MSSRTLCTFGFWFCCRPRTNSFFSMHVYEKALADSRRAGKGGSVDQHEEGLWGAGISRVILVTYRPPPRTAGVQSAQQGLWGRGREAAARRQQGREPQEAAQRKTQQGFEPQHNLTVRTLPKLNTCDSFPMFLPPPANIQRQRTQSSPRWPRCLLVPVVRRRLRRPPPPTTSALPTRSDDVECTTMNVVLMNVLKQHHSPHNMQDIYMRVGVARTS